ncbi:hypothetical protein [Microtetraspora glauca]|uniref:DUF1772 domain-containing protein n=1 Tax=Microtetraspora glauca TaxID=1996 RepID=A0ABV3GHZ0_MICGL
MIEKVGRERVGRRAWPWVVLAVLASAVPFVLMGMTASGGIDYLPIVFFAARFSSFYGRIQFPVDALVAGGLPLLVLAAAAAAREWRSMGTGVAALLGILAVVNLVLFMEYQARPYTPADVSAGSQQEFHTGFGASGVPPLLAAIACTVAAVALSVGSQRMRANRHR